MNQTCVIGVDAGTESLRAGVFDLQGNQLAFASTAYETNFPNPGWAEQNPRDWWHALGNSVRQAVEKAHIQPRQIAGLALDTTCCSVVALDVDGNALRPALIWMDVRSDTQTKKMIATGDVALCVNSNGKGPVSAEWMIPKSLWLKENEPHTFEKASTICEFQDYLNFHLTGRMVASINNVSIRWHYDRNRGGYPLSLLDKLGIEELAEKWPQQVLDLGTQIEGLTGQAAEHVGLPQGTPVVQGGADAFIGMLGLGVVRPGSLAFITGSSHLHLGLSNSPFHGAGIWGTYSDAVLPGLHVVEGGQTSTGSVVNWFKNLLGEGTTYDQLNKQASKLRPGSEGLVVQEHFQGNRTPHTDPNSRGSISGLALKHSPAHLFRAIMEGVAFGSELIFENMQNNGFTPENAMVSGGAIRSDLWLQIHADVSNLPLTLTECPEAPCLGSALLAAVATGHYDDIAMAADQMVRKTRLIEPNPKTHDEYRPFYEAYKATYLATRTAREPLESLA